MTDLDFSPDDSAVLIIDVQERFVGAIPSIAEDQPTGRTLKQLLAGCAILSVPTLISEQVPDKLGPTLPFVLDAANQPTVSAKSVFSCADDQTLRQTLIDTDRPHIIIAGIEAHVCVLTTVDDLLRRGYRVTVAVDAIASRNVEHAMHAITTMRQLGAACIPVETILMRLQRDAAGSCFKSISKLIR